LCFWNREAGVLPLLALKIRDFKFQKYECRRRARELECGRDAALQKCIQDTRIFKSRKGRKNPSELQKLFAQIDNYLVKLLVDCFGREVRLTDERLAHILGHQEMMGMESEIGTAVSQPKLVRGSRSDLAVRLFYDFCPETPVGGKWLCVVVKYDEGDAFVITAYLTNQPKAGKDLWPTK
jgi:hypothetical protein